MRVLYFSRFTLSSCVAAALLAACGGSQAPIGAPGAMPQSATLAVRTTSTNYKVLYSFGAAPDGNDPEAGLIDAGGTLYGTTWGGGSYSCPGQYFCGTVFSVTLGGTEKVLHSFGARRDGRHPLAGLIHVGGKLYGTTGGGGSHCVRSYGLCGTVFSITPSGVEKVLHTFRDANSGKYGFTDGAFPSAGLIDVSGTLYGTTEDGGKTVCYTFYNNSCGTVYSITTRGVEKVLYSFEGNEYGGAYPTAGLIDVKGTLYGTTLWGGYSCCGTVFSVTLGGTEQVLHSFGDGAGGAPSHPSASLIELNGMLYGTTRYGGAYSCGSSIKYKGCGSVFSITPGGTLNVLHSFGNGADGSNPKASLVKLKGTLYGTTFSGGAYGQGTIFSITPGGQEKVLYSFEGANGAQPVAGLIDVKGTLYGTTSGGGAYRYGTVFALTP
jgi:uncharacterized repeat protein (TIGR03803 family)